MKKINSFFKITAAALAVCGLLAAIPKSSVLPVYSQQGSSGREVEEIQKVLQEWGLFKGEITGYFGTATEAALRAYQKNNNLPVTGAADEETLKKMGITIGQTPTATQANINLLARIISAEGRGESYVGQVAIGAVICNRIEHPSFPDTLQGVIYQNGEFTAITDGQFNEPVSESAYYAARDALAGWDPTGGCAYYFNPKKTSDEYMHSKEVVKIIGDHYFCN
ncbi:MAG: cell wall hydrolase [Firmicutes bacterium]|nr:cell wall hydrolase [[Eubacterium] siraeum]MCM1488922.1 cell wall hydrolase [Bacillota bacterium]